MSSTETEPAGEAAPLQPGDAELVRRAKVGDLAVFETLATRHEGRIYTVARRITGHDHDAEDVTQQGEVEGFSVKETAAELGLSEANVKVRLLRARLQLREQLTQAFGDPAKRLRPHQHDHE